MKAKQLLAFCFLVGLGSLQMVGDVFDLPSLKGSAAATQVSPAMRVFTAHRGYETHAARFSLHWQDGNGATRSLPLDPHSYRGVGGPYNRRNVYGAALAYGPILRADPRTRPMQESVMRYAFCSPGGLRQELGIPPQARDLRVGLVPTRADARRDLELEWSIDCP